ncbi:ABC transporter permease [Brevibacillus invocatus]|uniref:ABC transporter permease n=1 Tax=Brevibacillus invocatus TaxID=173959 RepID=A0A3M8BYG0_9BACL|nr:ABC transporter permease [Brevibacillus invocatus]RNB68147.1 ABC transporter permease [Brevibacillus invocatus]
MYKLLRNENMKLYSKFGTWLMMAILLLVVGLVGLISKYDAPPPDVSQWRSHIEQNIQAIQNSLQNERNPQIARQLEDQLKINEYALSHGFVPIDYTAWSYTKEAISMIPLISLFVIVVAGGIVANEFSWGTIKSLLVKPHSRSKILLAKYMSVLQYALVLLILLFAATFACKGLLFDFSYWDTPYLSVDAQGHVQEGNVILHLFATYLLHSVELLFVATIAFMISTIFRNPSLAIGSSILLLVLGGLATNLLAVKYDWIKYSLFANTSLTMYQDGTPLIEGMTLPFSLIVLGSYFAVFMVITWTVFTKRDIVR